MRHWFSAVAAAGLLGAAVVQIGALPAAADTSSPGMLSFGAATNADRPVILRGSAVAPRAAAADAQASPSYEVAAGRRLWFFDPETLKIHSCINQQTTTVGVRRVRCYSGSLGGYRRTFGPAFQP
jgi:hypothetical protein